MYRDRRVEWDVVYRVGGKTLTMKVWAADAAECKAVIEDIKDAPVEIVRAVRIG